jgi:S1/P1 Nuclease
MKKKQLLSLCALFVAAVVLISWGVTGHRTVGKIAENHLTPQAKAAVQELLGTATLADVSTWPDEVRSQPEYKHTAPWHYLDLSLGLSYAEFQQKVENMTEENVYSAVLKQEQVLGSSTSTRPEKIEALKFVVHFVGDLHQPMHVSRTEDKGGNTIQLNYEGKGTNLHAVWDSRLLDHEGLDYVALAEKYDRVSAKQIKEWQSDPLIKWVWESYQISTKLYAEVDAMNSRSIDDSYYQAHIDIIHQRLVMAGVRLAGMLNTIFKNGLAASVAGTAAAGANGATDVAGAAKTIDIGDAAKHYDENVTICAKVYGSKVLDNMTLMNLGASYPDQLLTVVLRGDARDTYKGLDRQVVCVTGKVVSYKDKPEIIVTDPKMIVVSAKP